MRVLFYGGTKANNGPDNINKGIVSNLTDSFVYISGQGKYREMITLLMELLKSDAVVVSGVARKACILVGLANLLRKPSVYIMHGCAEYEYQLLNIEPDKKGLAQEAFLLKHTSLLLPVSRKFMHFVHQRYPEYAGKTEFLTNGIDPMLFSGTISHAKNNRVAVSGGLSPIKNNRVVAEAVEQMNGKATLEIFGAGRSGPVGEKKYSRLIKKLPNEVFLANLSEVSLFVLNSVYETFSIATMEALAFGTSILVSEAAGVTDILPLEETDIIHDPMDAEEIRGKIEYLLEHPNNERILSQLDVSQLSFQKMVERLESRCRKLIQR